MSIDSLRLQLEEKKESLGFAYLSHLHQLEGDLSSARSVAENGLQFHMGFVTGMIVLGKSLYKMGHYSLAKQQFEHVIMLDNRCPAAWKYLLKISLIEENSERVQDYFNHILELDPYYQMPIADEKVQPSSAQDILAGGILASSVEQIEVDASMVGDLLQKVQDDSFGDFQLEKEPEAAMNEFLMPETPNGDDISSAVDGLFGVEENFTTATPADVVIDQNLLDSIPDAENIGIGFDRLFEESENGTDSTVNLDESISTLQTENTGVQDTLNVANSGSETLGEAVASEFDSLFSEAPQNFESLALSESETNENALESEVDSIGNSETENQSLGEAVASEFDSLFSEAPQNFESVALSESETQESALETEVDSFENSETEEQSLGEAVESTFDNLFTQESNPAFEVSDVAGIQTQDLNETSLNVNQKDLEEDSFETESLNDSTEVQNIQEESLSEAVENSLDSLFASSDSNIENNQSSIFQNDFNIDDLVAPVPEESLLQEDVQNQDYVIGTQSKETLTSPDEIGDLDMSFGSFSEFAEPTVSENTLTMAEIYEKQGLIDRSIEILEQILLEEPENETAQIKLNQLKNI